MSKQVSQCEPEGKPEGLKVSLRVTLGLNLECHSQCELENRKMHRVSCLDQSGPMLWPKAYANMHLKILVAATSG